MSGHEEARVEESVLEIARLDASFAAEELESGELESWSAVEEDVGTAVMRRP